MSEKTIYMPAKLPDKYYIYNYLASLQNDIIDCPETHIVLDFTKCSFSHAIFTAFIGSLSVWAKRFDKSMSFLFVADSRLPIYFKHSGLYSFFTGDTSKDFTNKNAIPFKKIKVDDTDIIDYINNILSLAPIKLGGNAKGYLFKNLYEILINSSEHSEANDGVYSCGHWMPQRKELVFSVYDTGIGIPALIKAKINKDFSSEDALKWALTKGNSTKQLKDGTPRGVGLSDFRHFIKLNKGIFKIISNNIYYSFDGEVETFKYLEKPIIGTMISFIIRNDTEHIYIAK